MSYLTGYDPIILQQGYRGLE